MHSLHLTFVPEVPRPPHSQDDADVGAADAPRPVFPLPPRPAPLHFLLLPHKAWQGYDEADYEK